MRIIYKNVDYGEWEEAELSRLAEYIGARVEDLIQAGNDYEIKSKISTKAKNEVDIRLGPQRKISEVTANVAYMAMVVSLTVLKVSQSGSDRPNEDIAQILEQIFPNEQGQATAKLMGVIDTVIEGDKKSPLHAYGLDKSAEKAIFCADEAYRIIIEAASGFAQQNDNPAER